MHPSNFTSLNDATDDLMHDSSEEEQSNSGEQDYFAAFHQDPETGTYLDGLYQPIQFTTGDAPEAQRQRLHKQLDQQLDNLYLLGEHALFSQFDQAIDGPQANDPNDTAEDDSPVAHLTSAIEALAMNYDEDDDDIVMEEVEPEKDSAWWPYPSKQAFLIDMMDNQPRQRLSDDHLKTVLWVMRESGTPNVPSFSAIRKLQDKLAKGFGLAPRHYTTNLVGASEDVDQRYQK
ncbi:hypothetical protein BDZ89DRAFT_1150102 [Hymenopellis radicata]|nr:hypothetical protein BDZ89DRAFT_1150102 [Hymenopellis radicata]